MMCTSTLRSSEQRRKCRTRSENVWRVCLFYSQNNKIVWLSNMTDAFFEKFTRCAKVCGLFFLDCAFWMLIGWADKLCSYTINWLFVGRHAVTTIFLSIFCPFPAKKNNKKNWVQGLFPFPCRKKNIWVLVTRKSVIELCIYCTNCIFILFTVAVYIQLNKCPLLSWQIFCCSQDEMLTDLEQVWKVQA